MGSLTITVLIHRDFLFSFTLPKERIAPWRDKAKSHTDIYRYQFFFAQKSHCDAIIKFCISLLEGRKDVFKHEGISDELIEDYFSFYPTIKIKRIILGNNLTVEQKLPIVTLLHDLNKQFKYDFKIEHINNESELLAWR